MGPSERSLVICSFASGFLTCWPLVRGYPMWVPFLVLLLILGVMSWVDLYYAARENEENDERRSSETPRRPR